MMFTKERLLAQAGRAGLSIGVFWIGMPSQRELLAVSHQCSHVRVLCLCYYV